MRRFSDARGEAWEVVAGRESWGTFVALFISLRGDGEIRQTPLTSVGFEEATSELERLDNDALNEMLDRSVPNPLGTQGSE